MADPTTSDTPSPGGPRSDDDGPGYAEALAELEAILASLERADLDVDVLGERVARAAELIRRCRARIGAARLQVEQVVSELDQ
jgi:exodeoxyribonuclease VII small subunit